MNLLIHSHRRSCVSVNLLLCRTNATTSAIQCSHRLTLDIRLLEGLVVSLRYDLVRLTLDLLRWLRRWLFCSSTAAARWIVLLRPAIALPTLTIIFHVACLLIHKSLLLRLVLLLLHGGRSLCLIGEVSRNNH